MKCKAGQVLNKIGVLKCQHEQAVYTRYKKESLLIVGVYVDDLIITGANLTEVDEFKREMNQQFEMSDLGLLSYYLGIEGSQSCSDTDMAGDVVDRRSTGGMYFYLNGNLISWTSQKQRVIALSSCEADTWRLRWQHVRAFGYE
ncbi:uncharacterized protein LOC141704905, partial [Apium graveolens]|uniref:uncharacterized protein LOC141704905 n=1 Tax=Apium graveolens TaxID=4045 RepID=UPI003D7B008C